MAMQNNANAASAFGLLAPTDVMASMPTPTTYANGMKGYGSIGLYDQALAELTASNPDNMAAYNNLFGNQVAPINFGRQGGGGGFRGGANPTHNPTTPNPYNYKTWTPKEQEAHERQINPNSTINQLDSAYGQKSTYVPKQKDIAHQRKQITASRGERNKKYGGDY